MKFEAVEFKDIKDVHFGDHEVYMQFTDDEGAEAFRDWWEEAGIEAFTEHYTKKLLDRGVPENRLEMYLK